VVQRFRQVTLRTTLYTHLPKKNSKNPQRFPKTAENNDRAFVLHLAWEFSMTVSLTHSSLEELITENLSQVLDWAGVPHTGESYRDVKTEFSDTKSVTVRADRVFLLGSPPILGAVIEVQLHIDASKPGAWTAYAAQMLRTYAFPAIVIVLTTQPEVEQWARQPIEFVYGQTWTPTVLGPSNVPSHLTPETLRGRPGLGILCALVHSGSERADDLYTDTWLELKRLWSANAIAEDDFFHHFDTLLTTATAKWRQHMMENDMQTHSFLEELKARALNEGIEQGIERGLAGLRNAIVRMCQARGIRVTSSTYERLDTCHNMDTLTRWLENSINAQSSEDIFR
jgi:hypothetical protein